MQEWKTAQFYPSTLLANAHAQTLAAALIFRGPQVAFRRERWETPDGDFLDLDRVDGPAGSPLVVACHGLEGSSYSPYILRLMEQVQRRNWRGLAMNFRSCSGEINRKLSFYHSGETGDLNWVLSRVREEDWQAPIFLVGYSLGGNVIAKWLGEQQHEARTIVNGACVCSVPFDLAAGQSYLDTGVRKMYVQYFLQSLKRKLRQKREFFPEACDYEKALQAKTLWEFDDIVTAPLHGFKDYQDYYQRSSSKFFLPYVQVPLAVINSVDDPFIPVNSLPDQQEVSQYVNLQYTPGGGHVGFVARSCAARWLDEQIIHWLHFLEQNYCHLPQRETSG